MASPDSSTAPHQSFSSDLAKIIGFALMISGGVQTWLNNIPGSIASFGAGLLLLLLAFPHIFKSLSAFGFKAELRETIEQAKEAIAELRNFAAPSASVSIYTAAWSNRMLSEETIDEARQHHVIQVNRIVDSLRSLGVSEAEIEQSLRPWHEVNFFDLSAPIAQELISSMDSANHQVNEEMHVISRKTIDQADPNWNRVLARQNQLRQLRDAAIELNYRPFKENSSAMFSAWIESSHLTPSEQEALKEKIRPMLSELDYYIKHRRRRT